ncbi:MAG: hypothetical protein NTX90_01535, partial [Alphaproteobacteria bacterium]|nr:hypothetical protein [Alphaproteobacteria bacterium]
MPVVSPSRDVRRVVDPFRLRVSLLISDKILLNEVINMSFEIEELSFEPPVPLPLGDIAQATHEIRNAPLERLADANWLEDWLLLRLGLNNEMLHEFPQSLLPWCGHGVMSWQYPRQFSKYLVWLSQRKIGNYVEIGARRGGTFIITVEYLRRFNPIENALALDIVEQPIMRAYAESAQGCSYVILDSKSVAAKKLLQSRYWDLALIDGDHSARSLSDNGRRPFCRLRLA